MPQTVNNMQQTVNNLNNFYQSLKKATKAFHKQR